MPLLALLALERIVSAGRGAWHEYKTGISVGLGFPALICLLALMAPGAFGDTITDSDRATSEHLQQQLYQLGRQQGADENQISQYIYMYSLSNPANSEAISALRKGMVQSDALRSLMFLLAAAAALLLFARGSLKAAYAVGFVGVLILCDLYGVDKRYVSHSSFGPADSPGGHIVFTPTPSTRVSSPTPLSTTVCSTFGLLQRRPLLFPQDSRRIPCRQAQPLRGYHTAPPCPHCKRT